MGAHDGINLPIESFRLRRADGTLFVLDHAVNDRLALDLGQWLLDLLTPNNQHVLPCHIERWRIT